MASTENVVAAAQEHPEETGRNPHIPTKEELKSRLNDYRDKASEGYEKAQARVTEWHEKVADTSLKDIETSVGDYVKSNPGKSVLIAAGVGFVAGFLLRGGRH